MVKLQKVRDGVPKIVGSRPMVGVFFAGTSGIGSHTARALARHSGKAGTQIRIYIVGRKQHAADTVIAECKQANANGDYQFIQAADLSLIRCVNEVCDVIRQREEAHGADGRIDYLMLSQGGNIYLPRTETKEGVDVTMSLMYYSRMQAILRLMPLLLKSSLPAVVVSVYAAGMEGKIFPEDLSLRDLSRYSYSQARSHMCYMHTLFMESLAEQHPGELRLVHVFPGLVLGPQFFDPERCPAWFRLLLRILVPVFGRFTVQPVNNADRMLYFAGDRYAAGSVKAESTPDLIATTGGRASSGVYSLNWDCESNYKSKKYKTMDRTVMRKKVWDHTTAAFEAIEKEGVFTA